MSLYSAFDRFKHFEELEDPLVTQEGVLTPTVRRNRAVRNLTGNTGAVAATLGALGKAAALTTGAGVGITGGSGTVYKSVAYKIGLIYTVEILIDLTGLGSSTTDDDIIGVAGGPAHLGQLIAAETGTTILTVTMQCIEVPAGGVTDIKLWSATEATGVFDDAGGTVLTETALVDNAGAWTSGLVKGQIGTSVPAANSYLYLINGAAGVPGTYTAGKFIITLKGYD